MQSANATLEHVCMCLMIASWLTLNGTGLHPCTPQLDKRSAAESKHSYRLTNINVHPTLWNPRFRTKSHPCATTVQTWTRKQRWTMLEPAQKDTPQNDMDHRICSIDCTNCPHTTRTKMQATPPRPEARSEVGHYRSSISIQIKPDDRRNIALGSWLVSFCVTEWLSLCSNMHLLVIGMSDMLTATVW